MWLPSKLYVNFAADGVRLCEVAAWGRVRAQTVIPVHNDAGTAWQPSVQALAGWLAQHPGRRFELHVVLSDRFVRYQLLPWRAGVGGKAEWQAYAGHRFREVFGELATGWTIRMAPTPPGDAAMATAIDTALIEALHALSVRPPRLASLQPRFVAAYNGWRHKLKGKACWFASLEKERACVALIERGLWRTVRNESGTESSPQGLPALLRRLELSMEAPPAAAAVYLSGELHGHALPEQLGSRPLHLLQLPEGWSDHRRLLGAARGM